MDSLDFTFWVFLGVKKAPDMLRARKTPRTSARVCACVLVLLPARVEVRAKFFFNNMSFLTETPSPNLMFIRLCNTIEVRRKSYG